MGHSHPFFQKGLILNFKRKTGTMKSFFAILCLEILFSTLPRVNPRLRTAGPLGLITWMGDPVT